MNIPALAFMACQAFLLVPLLLLLALGRLPVRTARRVALGGGALVGVGYALSGVHLFSPVMALLSALGFGLLSSRWRPVRRTTSWSSWGSRHSWDAGGFSYPGDAGGSSHACDDWDSGGDSCSGDSGDPCDSRD